MSSCLGKLEGWAKEDEKDAVGIVDDEGWVVLFVGLLAQQVHQNQTRQNNEESSLSGVGASGSTEEK